MAMQTYASTSALLAPRISPRRTTVTRLFSVSASASSPSAALSLSTLPRTARPRTLTHAAKLSHAGASPARQRASSVRTSPGITREARGHDTGFGRRGRQQVASLEISCNVRHRDDVVLAGSMSHAAPVAEVSCSVMEESGASPLKRSLQRMAQIGADPSAAIHGHREVALVRRTTHPTRHHQHNHDRRSSSHGGGHMSEAVGLAIALTLALSMVTAAEETGGRFDRPMLPIIRSS